MKKDDFFRRSAVMKLCRFGSNCTKVKTGHCSFHHEGIASRYNKGEPIPQGVCRKSLDGPCNCGVGAHAYFFVPSPAELKMFAAHKAELTMMDEQYALARGKKIQDQKLAVKELRLMEKHNRQSDGVVKRTVAERRCDQAPIAGAAEP
jgi:hypothetical protein